MESPKIGFISPKLRRFFKSESFLLERPTGESLECNEVRRSAESAGAVNYIIPGTRLYHSLLAGQITVHSPSIGDLNARGKQLWIVLSDKFDRGNINGRIEGYHFNKSVETGNFTIVGTLKRRRVETSAIVFYTNDWAYTVNGSLYSLGDRQ